jgi:hypothetical protein
MNQQKRKKSNRVSYSEMMNHKENALTKIIAEEKEEKEGGRDE